MCFFSTITSLSSHREVKDAEMQKSSEAKSSYVLIITRENLHRQQSAHKMYRGPLYITYTLKNRSPFTLLDIMLHLRVCVKKNDVDI